MSSSESFVAFVTEHIENAGVITSRKMFGEYAIYSNRKVVALVCDNQLFVKATEQGRAFIGSVKEAPPYPGAKPGFLVGDKIDDRDWLSELIKITAAALPEPKAKKHRKR